MTFRHKQKHRPARQTKISSAQGTTLRARVKSQMVWRFNFIHSQISQIDADKLQVARHSAVESNVPLTPPRAGTPRGDTVAECLATQICGSIPARRPGASSAVPLLEKQLH